MVGDRIEAGVELEIESGMDSAELKTGAGVEIEIALFKAGAGVEIVVALIGMGDGIEAGV